MSVSVVIPTYQAEKHLPRCLPPLLNSPLKPKILIIDSSSSDATPQIAKQFGVELLSIPKSSFNHGATREYGRKRLATDICVMVSQDAYASNNFVLEKLLTPLLKKKAALAYARQIPHAHASPIEKYARSFNYPATSQLRSLDDAYTLGIYTFFASNAFCAYDNALLDSIGGFAHTMMGEDAIACARLLRQGYKVAYVAEAEVYHSHNHSLYEEFSRHIAIGTFRKRYEPLFACSQGDTQRGLAYTQALLLSLYKKSPTTIPYACLHTLVKWVGYQIGKI